MDCDKTLPNNVFDKDLISKRYKKPDSIARNNPIQKWTKDLNRCFLNKTYQ
jgi:hypothetical protein